MRTFSTQSLHNCQKEFLLTAKVERRSEVYAKRFKNLSFGFISLIYRIFWSSLEFFWLAHSSFDMGFAKKIEI
jgi:hypothetical protein